MKYSLDSQQYSEFPIGISIQSNTHSSISSIFVDSRDGFVYVSGSFSDLNEQQQQQQQQQQQINNVMVFNGTNWLSMGNGVDFEPTAIILDQNGENLYFGSSYSMNSLITNQVGFFAIWNLESQKWNFPFIGTSQTFALLPFGNDSILLGGFFQIPNSECISDFAIYYPGGNAPTEPKNPISTDWISMGGIDGENNVVIIGNSELNEVYVGGRFIHANGQILNNVGKFDGKNWTALGQGISIDKDPTLAVVNSLYFIENSLFVGGYFTLASGVVANYFAKYNGSWFGLGLPKIENTTTTTTTTTVIGIHSLSFIESNQMLVVGGFFNIETTSTNGSVWNLALYNIINETWFSIGGSVNGIVYTTVIDSKTNSIFVGGNFTKIGDLDCSGIAKWDGSNWSNLNGGISSSDDEFMVKSLTFWQGKLFVGGKKIIIIFCLFCFYSYSYFYFCFFH